VPLVVKLAASCMLTAASYLRNFRVCRVLAILATVLVITLDPALTCRMRALIVVCHIDTLLSKAMLGPRDMMVKFKVLF